MSHYSNLIGTLLCGWVLWQQYDVAMSKLPGEAEVRWAIEDAYESRTECVRERFARKDAFLARPPQRGITREVRGAQLITWFEGPDGTRAGSRSEQYWCLPVGTDPRPRGNE